jgi:hypothetical protein
MRGRAQVHRGVPVAHRRVRQSTGEVGLADTGRADDRDVVVAAHEARLGQGEHLWPLEASPAPEVDVLDDGVGSQLGLLQATLETAVLPLGDLPVDEHPEALLEAERLVVGPLTLLGEPGGHRHQPQGMKSLDGLVVEQSSS